MRPITTHLFGGLGRSVGETAGQPRAESGAPAFMKGTWWFLVVVVASCGHVRRADAEHITIALTARVNRVEDRGGFLGGAVAVGDTIKGVYTYESTTPDTNPLPSVGDYRHTTPPFGIRLEVNGLVFRTDPNDVSFLVEIVDDHPWDKYLLQSYNNLFDVSVPLSDPRDIVDNHISWQLDDQTATALSSAALPTGPPVLADWQSVFGLDILSSTERGDFLIRADVISAQLVPEPSTWRLLGTGLGGLLGYGWCRRRAGGRGQERGRKRGHPCSVEVPMRGPRRGVGTPSGSPFARGRT